MLGIANSSTGQKDWHNILGGVECLSRKKPFFLAVAENSEPPPDSDSFVGTGKSPYKYLEHDIFKT